MRGQKQTTGIFRRFLKRGLEDWEFSEWGKGHRRTKVGLNQIWSFKKPKINSSQWQSALWEEQRCKDQ